MSFIGTPADDDPAAAALFDADRAALGHVANYTRVFAHNPAAYAAWQQLNGAIKQGMELRTYELATFAAATRLRSSYCSLAHGAVLRDRFFDAPTVEALATDPTTAGVSEADVAIMAFADKVAAGAASITEADVATLTAHGLSDADVFQVVLAAAARCFFSTVLDAVGARPDAAYRETVEPSLREALTVGRDIED